MMKIFSKIVCIVLIAVSLGGCATSGQFNGLDSDPMKGIIVIRGDGLPLTEEQKMKVTQIVIEMSKVIHAQMSSSLEAAAASGIANRIAGGFTDGAIGIISGFSSYSYAMVYAIAEATELSIRDREKMGYTHYEYVHVIPAFVRSLNSRFKLHQE